MMDTGRPTHYVHPHGGMLHALRNLSSAPQGTHLWERVTCGVCLFHKPIQENEMNDNERAVEASQQYAHDRITEVSATVDAGLTQEDLDGMGEAERLALVVGAAYGKALAERDQARDQVDHLNALLGPARALLKRAIPTLQDSTWAADSSLAGQMADLLERMAVDSVQTNTTQED